MSWRRLFTTGNMQYVPVCTGTYYYVPVYTSVLLHVLPCTMSWHHLFTMGNMQYVLSSPPDWLEYVY